ncbi:MAG TPA: aldehyde dehydrogenase family protein [Mycobacteriales bacterium]|nr:aldehyde dehydrogenase family protein [Mycobacteriales bacterium]
MTEQTFRLFIGGEWVEPAAGTYAVVNPATEEAVARAPEVAVGQVADAVAAARAAFPAWSRRPAAERAELLTKLADAFERRIPDLVPLVQAETGATMRVARTLQVTQCAIRFRTYAKLAMQDHDIPLPPSVMPNTALAKGGLIGALAARQPVGVVACITPYNFPLTNMAGKVAPALAMGNTVVVKPAPQDPLAILRFAEAVEEAGFPPGVFNVVTGSGADAGQALVEADIDMVSFTGSTPVGQKIAETAGRGMKRLLLELGGKGAAVVFDDGDVKGAVAGIGSTWSFHSGQICTAPTRVIAHRAVHDQLVDALAGYAKVLKVGDPLADDTVVGPVISAMQRDRVESLLDTGRSDGAEFVVGGERPDIDRGYYVTPTLLTGVKNDMQVAQEEFFGPVVVVETFDDEDEAVALANGTAFGLYDYVWTADATRGYRVARQLRSGNVGINTVQRNHEAPFGGFKQSGVGRDGGVFGLHAYSELQSIVWPS